MPLLSATERLSGVCIIYLYCNIYWDLVFNNCHSNISFLNPFRSAAIAILNIYQHCSCIHWLGCNFFVIKDLQDIGQDLGRIGRDQRGRRGEIWSWKPLLGIQSWSWPSPGKGGSSSIGSQTLFHRPSVPSKWPQYGPAFLWSFCGVPALG